MLLMTDGYYLESVNEYMRLIRKYRDLMNILFFGSQGSSMENYIECFSDRATELTMGWLERIGEQHIELNSEMSVFSIHLHTVWMIVFFKEILMHEVEGAELERAISEYIRFEISGWKKLFYEKHR